MIGSEEMSLLGWKQLAKWSLEHSCMDEAQKKEVTEVWQEKWDEFCKWIVNTYSDLLGYEHQLDLSRADWVAHSAH
jgi:adenosine deaminase CECR1